MNSVKVTYIICQTICYLVLLALAVAAPVWITPGYYYWTLFGIFLMIAESYGFENRLDSWNDLENFKLIQKQQKQQKGE